MSSTFILKVRICKSLVKPLFHQGSSAVFTQKTSLCTIYQIPFSARFLCTRDSNPNPDGRQRDRKTSGRGEVKNTTIRYREEQLWDDTVNGKSITLRQRPSFPKSVFTAGTAKRTAEMMRRKAALVSQDEEQHVENPDRRTTRRAGRT